MTSANIWDCIYCFRTAEEFSATSYLLPLQLSQSVSYQFMWHWHFVKIYAVTLLGHSVGEPLDVPRMPEPTKEVVDGIHKKYMDALVKLFKDYNPKYGAPDLKVEIH